MIYISRKRTCIETYELRLNDRVIRLISGLGLVTFDYLASSSWEVIFLFFGAWGVLTSAFGYCPFYRIIGYNSCPTNLPNPANN